MGFRRFKKERDAKKYDSSEQKAEFRILMKEVCDMALPSLNKFQRQKIQADRLEALGCKRAKHRTMPLPELRSRRRSAQKSIARQASKDKESGVRTTQQTCTLEQYHSNQRRDRRENFEQQRTKEIRILNGRSGHIRLRKDELKALV